MKVASQLRRQGGHHRRHPWRPHPRGRRRRHRPDHRRHRRRRRRRL